MAELRVLYVEDDARLARLTADYLGCHDVEVHVLPRGELAISEIDRIRPDLVILDLTLPDVDGIEVCRRLRRRHGVPIIMVTGRTSLSARVDGLEGGADDYMVKPFDARELLARVRALTRRAQGKVAVALARIVVGALTIDPGSRTVHVRDAEVAVTTAEFDVLYELARHAGHVVTRGQLLATLHGDSSTAIERSIDVLIGRLRAKLELDARNPELVRTIRGAGYLLHRS